MTGLTPLTLMRGIKVAGLSAIEPGEIFLIEEPNGTTTLALRASEDGDAPDQPAVLLRQNTLPEFIRFQASGVACVVLGKPEFRVSTILESFRTGDANEKAGSLILEGDGNLHLIARHSRGTVRINVRTGQLVGAVSPKWYVTAWHLCLERTDAHLAELLSWPGPSA